MFRLLPLCFLFLLLPLLSGLQAQCTQGRFFNKTFTAQQTFNVNFGRNANYQGDSVDLNMHIFTPQNDLLAYRPLIILAFGGSFTSGVKESPDILQLCQEFAQRGYVTATIDYRTGVENGSDSSRYKALIRAIQDMRAALGFFHKDAQTERAWRVDTSQIYIGGVSAGGFIGLNLAYYKQGLFSIAPPEWLDEMADAVGGLYGMSGQNGYGQNIKGVINLCGGIADTVWIYPGDPILCSMHGSADETVPWCKDENNTSVTARFFGSQCIHERANRMNLVNDFYPFYGADHVPFVLPIPFLPPASLYMDTTIRFVRDFLYQHTTCNPELISSIAESQSSATFAVYPNPAQAFVYFTLDAESKEDARFRLLDLTGKSFSPGWINRDNALYALSVEELAPGSYLLEATLQGKRYVSRFQVIR
jgi:hypothetical protein